MVEVVEGSGMDQVQVGEVAVVVGERMELVEKVVVEKVLVGKVLFEKVLVEKVLVLVVVGEVLVVVVEGEVEGDLWILWRASPPPCPEPVVAISPKL